MELCTIAWTEFDRAELAKMVSRLFEHWRLTSRESLELLGLSPSNRSALIRYRHGQPLKANRDLVERALHLLNIHASLRLLFPNRKLAYQWMTTPNRAFDGETPVQLVKTRGFVALLIIRNYLNRTLE